MAEPMKSMAGFDGKTTYPRGAIFPLAADLVRPFGALVVVPESGPCRPRAYYYKTDYQKHAMFGRTQSSTDLPY